MKTVCYLAHCLLNVNSRVDEGAYCAGVYSPVVSLLRERGCTIRQMPCPELAFGGTRRFWAVREQYDTPAFRAHLRKIGAPIAAQIRADLEAGHRVILVGIDGSPTMGVALTASSDEWGGRPDKPLDEDYPRTPGPGLFVETILELVGPDAGSVTPVGIGQDGVDYDEPLELAKLGDALALEADDAR